jgi:hypothetical protein
MIKEQKTRWNKQKLTNNIKKSRKNKIPQKITCAKQRDLSKIPEFFCSNSATGTEEGGRGRQRSFPPP